MILLFLTVIIPAIVATIPGLLRHTPIVIDSPESCQFRVGTRHYDLCPLFGGEWPLLVKGGSTKYRFHFGLDSGHPDDLCPFNSRICIVSENLSETRRVLGSSIVTVSLNEAEKSLILQFSGGAEGAAEIRLVCDSQIQSEKPVFSRVENNIHYFTWRTKYACETGRRASETMLNALDMESDLPPPDDTVEPSEPSGPDEGKEQLLDSDRQRKSRRSTAIIFAVISIIIISLSIISYRHPQRLNFFFSEHIRPLFRRLSFHNLPRFSLPHPLKPAGEGRLVRWAQEDLELDEDMMVNGTDDPYDEPDDAGDEYIPLRPSPRKGGRVVKNYGSATSPFW